MILMVHSTTDKWRALTRGIRGYVKFSEKFMSNEKETRGVKEKFENGQSESVECCRRPAYKMLGETYSTTDRKLRLTGSFTCTSVWTLFLSISWFRSDSFMYLEWHSMRSLYGAPLDLMFRLATRQRKLSTSDLPIFQKIWPVEMENNYSHIPDNGWW